MNDKIRNEYIEEPIIIEELPATVVDKNSFRIDFVIAQKHDNGDVKPFGYEMKCGETLVYKDYVIANELASLWTIVRWTGTEWVGEGEPIVQPEPEPIPPNPIEVALAYALGLEVELTPEILEHATSSVPITVPSDGDEWRPGIRVDVGTTLVHNGITYVALQRHVTQADWRPDLVPALWRVTQGTPNPGEVLQWMAGEHVEIGDKRKHGGRTFIVLQAHTTQIGWEPPNVPALWSEVSS